MTQNCDRPAKLPERDVTQFEVETLWTKDRRNLIICGKRHDALTRYYLDRDALIRKP